MGIYGKATLSAPSILVKEVKMKNICATVVIIIGLLSITVDTTYGQSWLKKRRYRKTGIDIHVSDAYGQPWQKSRRYGTIGLNINAMNYLGETAPDANITSLRLLSTRLNFGATYTYKFTPRISARGSLSWGRIYGDDKKSASENEEDNIPRFQRNLNFRNNILELNGVAIFELFENGFPYRRRPDFMPYGFIGIGVFKHNPKAYFDGEGMEAGYYELQPLGTEGQYVEDRESKGYPKPYRLIQLAIPVGFGARYKIDSNIDIGFEICWRKTFTDYIDDISTNYADKGDLTAAKGRTAALLSDRSADSGFTPVLTDNYGYQHISGFGLKGDQRGDISDKDWYITTGIALYYILPYPVKCPKPR